MCPSQAFRAFEYGHDEIVARSCVRLPPVLPMASSSHNAIRKLTSLRQLPCQRFVSHADVIGYCGEPIAPGVFDGRRGATWPAVT